MLKHKLVDFIIQFMEEVDKEISEMKLFVCGTSLQPAVPCANQRAVGNLDTDTQTAKRKSTVRGGIFSDTSKHFTYPRFCMMLTMYFPVRLELDLPPLYEALVWMHRAARVQRRYAIMP